VWQEERQVFGSDEVSSDIETTEFQANIPQVQQGFLRIIQLAQT